jgi:hypothetical protein
MQVLTFGACGKLLGNQHPAKHALLVQSQKTIAAGVWVP